MHIGKIHHNKHEMCFNVKLSKCTFSFHKLYFHIIARLVLVIVKLSYKMPPKYSVILIAILYLLYLD